jgi:sigma-54 dependent transcriptional regulator, acetoin dehydrogenase operon transcriptional activator AcoR
MRPFALQHLLRVSLIGSARVQAQNQPGDCRRPAMPIHSYTAHVQELEAFGMGYPLHGEARDRAVLGSWRRCIDQHRLDPSRTSEAHIVPAGQLRAHREESEPLIRIARSGLERLYQQLKGLDYVLLLADRHGVAVDFLGHDSDASDLRSAGLYLGAQWREDVAGTSAVGTCLATGEALTVHQSDHFDFTHTRLSCTAAPIYDLQGQLAAVLDLSLLRSPAARASQQMALHLVTAAVRRVELANLMAQSGSDWVLRLAQSPDFLDVDADAALSIDARGRIRAMTHAASRMLASIAGLNWRQQPLLTGQPLGRFFDTDLQALPQLMRNRPAQERILRARDGSIWFAHALPPQPRSSAQASPRPSLPAPLQALNTGDAAMGQVLHKAARLAPQDLPVLLQGETGSGKEFLARALHAASGRSGAFVAINCAAIPEALLESELFGYLPGTWTGGAHKGRAGLVEAAHQGSLFLDEIGDMPLALQAKLLRVLSESEITPLGARAPQKVDIRVISASHRPVPRRPALPPERGRAAAARLARSQRPAGPGRAHARRHRLQPAPERARTGRPARPPLARQSARAAQCAALRRRAGRAADRPGAPARCAAVQPGSGAGAGRAERSKLGRRRMRRPCPACHHAGTGARPVPRQCLRSRPPAGREPLDHPPPHPAPAAQPGVCQAGRRALVAALAKQ